MVTNGGTETDGTALIGEHVKKDWLTHYRSTLYGFHMRISAIAAISLVLLCVTGGCSRKKEVRVFQMGEKAEVGPFIYQAGETHWLHTLGDRTAKDRFFVIHISALNSSSKEATVPAFEVVDDAGNEFPELPDGTGVDNWVGITRKLPVANTLQGSIVFDVPPKHYRLKVSDENDEFMYYDIPLSLTSEEPNHP